MERRILGRTGLDVSAIGFGCGMVGGLMVGGSVADQENAVAHALDCGIDYFDTAPFYGGGQSEANLGRVLKQLRRRAVVGTKIRIDPATRDDPAQMHKLGTLIAASAEDSLRRLGTECLDLLQLHNPVSVSRAGSGLTPGVVLEEVLPAFQRLVREGKVRFVGMSALGHAPDAIQVLEHGGFDTAQVAYSLLNPSAETPLPPAAQAEDYGRLLEPVRRGGIGVIGIRLLAGGSLSGSVERHPTAMRSVVPLGQGTGSGKDYEQDVAYARRFGFLVQEGLARSLVAAALRYGLSNPTMHTLAIGFSSREQLTEAAQAAADGPFDRETLQRISRVQMELGLAAG
ncbi:MAG TPA: aldo/keto reductase [Ramlibacter sp.]|uniref:aldo/keto reductase n=1 Tax=Ramlibacter sp. TaxID=1917967 RepID=UPI002C21E85E|nr:aldo/keto reductase [Ramlibacter sp.]HVZ45212.1 aldo/keto reductase [Ramlibacter sp.]